MWTSVQSEKSLIRARHGDKNQYGQAVIEGLVVAGALGSLVVAALWLGRLQDVALQLQHASRRAAFAHAHQGLDPARLSPGVDGYLASAGHAWQTRSGGDLLAAPGPHAAGEQGTYPTAEITLDRLTREPSRQAGDGVAGAAQWRAELQLGDSRVWRAGVRATAGSARATDGRLHDFDRLHLELYRETAILVGSGAAAGDREVQQTLAASAHAWTRLSNISVREGRAAEQRLQAVDAAWGRARPDWDWLGAWEGLVPLRHLNAGGLP